MPDPMDRLLSIYAAAEEVPDRIAIVNAGDPLTYAEVAERTRTARASLTALARAEAEQGRKLERVALVATESLETILFAYAAIELAMPIVLLHPRSTEIERAEISQETCAQILTPTLTEPPTDPGPGPSRGSDPESPLAILHTSGTTGRRKGAMLSRRAFLESARLTAARLAWHDGDRWLLALPIAHIGGFSILTRTLIARQTLVFPRPGATVLERIIESIALDRVTIVSLVPTLLHRLLRRVPAWSPPAHLRAILLGGAPATEAMLDESSARGWPVLTTYGLTEACSQVTLQRPGTRPSAIEGAGEPLDGIEVRIGADEEIEIRGPTLFSGYLSHAAPFLPGGWFRTGDLGAMDAAGRLVVQARRADLIISGGENVYPSEVERALESEPGIEEAAVFGQPDEEWGEIVSALLVPADRTSPLDTEAIARAMSAKLAPFKRPRRFVIVDALPKNALGKIDRRALNTYSRKDATS